MKTKPRDPKICITYPVFGDQNIKWYSRKGKKNCHIYLLLASHTISTRQTALLLPSHWKERVR